MKNYDKLCEINEKKQIYQAKITAEKNEAKENAKKELMELKGYLDLGIITQQEFDKKAESLKKILLGN